MNYYNDAVMMAYQLGIWERVPENGSQHSLRAEQKYSFFIFIFAICPKFIT